MRLRHFLMSLTIFAVATPGFAANLECKLELFDNEFKFKGSAHEVAEVQHNQAFVNLMSDSVGISVVLIEGALTATLVDFSSKELTTKLIPDGIDGRGTNGQWQFLEVEDSIINLYCDVR